MVGSFAFIGGIRFTADSFLSRTSSSLSSLELGHLPLSGCKLLLERFRLCFHTRSSFACIDFVGLCDISGSGGYSEFRNLSFSFFSSVSLKALRYEREKRFDVVLLRVEHWSENSGDWIGDMAEWR